MRLPSLRPHARKIDRVRPHHSSMAPGSRFKPGLYRDGKRALLASEKGPAGERAFGRAFAAWDDPNRSPASTDRIGARKRG
jgi:hypothetical protein